MCHTGKEKQVTIHDEKNRFTKQGRNQNTWRKGNLQILGNIGSGHYQTSADERKNEKRVYQENEKLLETKLNSGNLIKGMNTWAVPLARYSGLFLTWTKEQLRQMNQRTRELMTMHKALRSRDDVDCMCSEKEEEEDLPILRIALTHRYNSKTT